MITSLFLRRDYRNIYAERGINYIERKLALTRTLMAYCIDSSVANLLCRKNKYAASRHAYAILDK